MASHFLSRTTAVKLDVRVVGERVKIKFKTSFFVVRYWKTAGGERAKEILDQLIVVELQKKKSYVKTGNRRREAKKRTKRVC